MLQEPSEVLCSLRTRPLEMVLATTLPLAGRGSENNESFEVHQGEKAFILKQGKGCTSLAEICRRAGISQATYFRWKKHYGGLLPDNLRRLKAIDDKNSRLKKVDADLTVDREMLQDVTRRKLRSLRARGNW